MKERPSTDRIADPMSVTRRLLSGDDGPDSTLSSFLRGLTAGALIGAAIAGSALLQRRRSKTGDSERTTSSS